MTSQEIIHQATVRCTRVFGRRRESEEFGIANAEIFGRTVAAKVRHCSAVIEQLIGGMLPSR